MAQHNVENERIKRRYFTVLKEAKRHSEPTVDASAKALNRFEAYTRHRDFRAFHIDQAIAFKKHLAQQNGHQSGEELSKATVYATLAQLKRFFQWLACQPGYRSRSCPRQGEIIRALATPLQAGQTNADEIAEAVVRRFRASGVDMPIK
jgi:hypothetical protein